MYKKIKLAGLLILIIGISCPTLTFAQSDERNKTGVFDYLILALSWSPQFCADEKNQKHNTEQCVISNAKGNKSFSKIDNGLVVHGLWPQFNDGGYPQNCQKIYLEKNEILSAQQLFPSKKLMFNEWNKHGSCYSANPQKYFSAISKLKEQVDLIIPAELVNPQKPERTTAEELILKFITTAKNNNIKLQTNNLVIQCTGAGRFLKEIRICYAKDLTFTTCDNKLINQAKKSCGGKSFLIRNL